MGGATRSRAASPAPGAGRREPRAERRELLLTLRERLLHAVDLAVAFATLRDAEETTSAPRGNVDRAHPHRTPLRPPTRPRRPGAAGPRKQHCITPVEGARPRLPRRRTRAARD